jgi:hypothetical protein
MEEKLLNRQTTDTALIDALRDDDRGSVHDKLRLFLLNYICSDISEVCAHLITYAMWTFLVGTQRADGGADSGRC